MFLISMHSCTGSEEKSINFSIASCGSNNFFQCPLRLGLEEPPVCVSVEMEDISNENNHGPGCKNLSNLSPLSILTFLFTFNPPLNFSETTEQSFAFIKIIFLHLLLAEKVITMLKKNI